ncbi:MAG: GatB/YqeY domain-containing protein [Bacillota bacterium]
MLAERLTEDLKQAMKDQDKLRLSVLRMVRAAIKNVEIEKRRPLTDDEVLDVLNRELKQRQESLAEFEKAGRDDLSRQAEEEIRILRQYLPEPLDEEALAALIDEVIRETGATTKRDLGKVMSVLMPKVKGRADGKKVNQMVQQRLADA